MADQVGEVKKTPALSPVTIVIGILAVAGVAILLLFPNILGGAPPATQSATQGGITSQTPVTVTKAAEALKPQDPLASFLVKFGRSNPFAPLGTVYASTANTRGTSPADSSMGDLRTRLQQLQTGEGAGSSSQTGSGSRQGTLEQDRARDGFVLTGIVRAESYTYAVLEKDDKGYIVAVGEPLGKTGYTLRAIEEEKVTIASGENELVLSLRRSKT